MRSLNPDRLIPPGSSASFNAAMLLPSTDFRRVSAQHDDDRPGGLFRVGGGVADAVASPPTVMLSDGAQITFGTIAA
jgi:hypothetical protein